MRARREPGARAAALFAPALPCLPWPRHAQKRIIHEGIKAVNALVLSLGLFLMAGLCEIAGGYLVWRVARGPLGPSVSLAPLPRRVRHRPDLPARAFGRVYAAYGGVFVVGSLLWGWRFDGIPPDRFDVGGRGALSGGVGVIMYAPR